MKNFLLITAFAFGCLLLAWPVLRTPYQAALFGLADVTFACLGKSEVRIEAVEGAPRSGEARLVVAETAVGQQWTIPFDSRFVAYAPTALFVALFLATSWSSARRRRRALLFGVGGLHLLILMHFAVLYLFGLTEHARTADHPHAEVLASAGWFRFVDTLVTWTYGGGEPTTYLCWVLILWALVAFERSDWRRWSPVPVASAK